MNQNQNQTMCARMAAFICLIACLSIIGAPTNGAAASASSAASESAPILYVQNPFLLHAADPDVVLIASGSAGGYHAPYYVLTHTPPGTGGRDFPLYVSTDLVNWNLHGSAFNVTMPANKKSAVQIGNYWYCGCWAPEVRPAARKGGYALTFTASRYDVPKPECPPYDEGSGVFMAYSDSPLGPFVIPEKDEYPMPVGASTDTEVCPTSLHDLLPQSHDVDMHNCGRFQCNNSIRLDGDLFNDPQTGDSWLAYAWYSNSDPMTDWDQTNLGEHVSLVKVDPMNPRQVPCDLTAATKVWVASPHDDVTLQQLSDSCPRCEEMLSMVRGRQGEIVKRDGVVWGVTEGPMLFRRNGWVYLIISHSIWDSAYYSAAWFAAPTVEELDITNGPSPNRLVGRLLVPSEEQSFGHGTAVQGPAGGDQWFYIHHHLNHSRSRCYLPTDACSRDLFITPLVFEDRGDGRGDVWIRTQLPAENGPTAVRQKSNHNNNDNKLSLVSLLLALGIVLLVLIAVAAIIRKRQSTVPCTSGASVNPPTDSNSYVDAALLQHQYHYHSTAAPAR